MRFIPYGRQSISEEDIESVVDVLRSDFLTQGPVVEKFEYKTNLQCGSDFAVAMNSATSALHAACLALGVEKGDLVWTTPITFIASANCALYCNAEIDFVDIDPQTYNISVSALAEKLEQSAQAGRLPKVIICVHLAGQSCEMEPIHSLAKQYEIKIIEDASHALGGSYKGVPVGASKFSDITVMSFHPVKIITTGEGGMALTNDESLARKMRLIASQGTTRNADEMTQLPEGPWYYEQLILGYNYRLTEIQAALGVSQLDRLMEFISKRCDIAAIYDEQFSELPVTVPWMHPDTQCAYHLYIIRLKLNRINKSHKEVFEELRAGGLGVNLHYIPVYRQPFYRKFGYDFNHFPESESYYKEAISLPIFPDLSAEDIDQVVSLVKNTIQ